MFKDFKIRTVTVRDGDYSYTTHQLAGRLNGERIRKSYKSREEADGELNRLSVMAANIDGDIRAVNTRLSPAQLADAEAAFRRLGDRSILLATEWFLANYRPPSVEMRLELACDAFTADRKGNVSTAVETDYKSVLNLLKRAFPERLVHTITTPELEALMKTRGQAKKSWNNLRIYLHSFFAFCAHDARRWVATNPAKAIPHHEIARGLPSILTLAQAREIFAYLENYAGTPGSGQKKGFLVPYFALGTFAGIRPSVSNGDLRKVHEREDKSRIIDETLGVIRLSPELTKTNSLRQVTIQPNLAKWLKRYPLAEFPLMVANMEDQVGLVRKHFKLGADVLRHTFCSYHAAKFKSIGGTAMEAGNSEAVIKKFYLNSVTEKDAKGFWGIVPKA